MPCGECAREMQHRSGIIMGDTITGDIIRGGTVMGDTITGDTIMSVTVTGDIREFGQWIYIRNHKTSMGWALSFHHRA